MPLHRQILLALILGILLAIGLNWVDPALQAQVLSVTQLVGTLFLNALKAVAIPLVVVTLISGVGGLDQRLGRLGSITMSYYIGSTLLAVLTGLLIANVLTPGLGITPPDGGWLATAAVPEHLVADDNDSSPWTAALLLLIPSNLFAAASAGNLLALIVFALLFALALRTLPNAQRQLQRQFWDGLHHILLTVTLWVLKTAPIGVLALVCTSASQMGWAALKPLAMLMFSVLLALALHATVNLGFILWRVAKVHLSTHASAMSPALWMAFSSASSSATLPVTLRCLHDRAGVDKGVTGLTVPLGTTMNMDGTALYECVAVLFLAQLLGFDLSLAEQLIVVALSLATTLGMAGIPSASLVAIAVILDRVGLPPEALGLLLITDRPLDMARTAVNVWSDSVAARVVARYYTKEPEAIA